MSDSISVRAFAPATVSNVACGFDIFGFAIAGPGDHVVARPRPQPGVEIAEITGDGGRLPREPAGNTAGVAVRALLAKVGSTAGVALSVHKQMPLASGLGSSAASGVAAVVAVSHLLELDLPPEELLKCALEGERSACGSAHGDNAAPSLYGGFVLVRRSEPPDVVPLPVPDGLACALVRPHIEIATGPARQLLGDTVPLTDAVIQWANVGGLVAGLYRGDFELIARCLEDRIAEPKRAPQVPGFAVVRQAAIDAGALGCSLSGSGPSIFALCRCLAEAETVADRMMAGLAGEGLAADRIVSPVGVAGARIV